MSTTARPAGTPRLQRSDAPLIGRLVASAFAWMAAYLLNDWFWPTAVSALKLDSGDHWVGAVQFFAYDTVKILLLLVGLMFVIGLLRSSLDLDRARVYLEGRGLAVGLVLAVVLGVVTPFCSCSSIPLFIGFVAAGIPLSVTLTFLIASPLVSEIAAIMIGDQFGWGIAAAYVGSASLLAILIGWVFSRFDLERWVEDVAKVSRSGALRAGGHVPTLAERIEAAATETRDIFKDVAPWVLGGVAIGAAIHGWVPTDFFLRFAGPDHPMAVVIATIAGVPLYVNGAGVVPIGEALWAKGMSLGTVMAFMMSSIALSIPQAVMLRKVLKPPLLALYFGTVTIGIMLLGFGFNLVQI